MTSSGSCTKEMHVFWLRQEKREERKSGKKIKIENDGNTGCFHSLSYLNFSTFSEVDFISPLLQMRTLMMPGKGNGNPLKYSGLENSMDRGAW